MGKQVKIKAHVGLTEEM